MPPQTLAARVERLEKRVTILEELPDRVDALGLQISQLREEMHGGFSAIRDEIRAGDEQVVRVLREEIRAGDEQVVRLLREEIRESKEEVTRSLREEIRESKEEVTRSLREEIRAMGKEVMDHARMLYEDAREKLQIVKEGEPAPWPSRSKKRT